MPYKNKEDRNRSNRESYARNRDSRLESGRIFYKKNKEKILAKRVYNPEWHRVNRLKKYGLSPNDFDELMKIQNGVCAICKENRRPNKILCVDHCHETGEVRGLLCDLCNLGLGKFDDNTVYLKQAIKYLEVKDVT